MNLITKLPGPFLIFLGAFSLSFGGLIVKSFEGATLWQILFWRSLFFSLTVLTFLLISYKRKHLKHLKILVFQDFSEVLFYLLVSVVMFLLCITPQ